MTVTISNSEQEAESWEDARKIASVVGNVSSLFSSCIRFLRKDAEANNAFSSSSLFALQRLLNSDSFKAPIFYAAKVFKPEEVSKFSHITSADLARFFTPDELANLIGMLYLYRRIQKTCDATEWEEISKNIHPFSTIGGHLGVAIPKINLSWGMFLGSIRHLSFGLLLGIDKKRYIQYRRQQKINKKLYSLADEKAIWGCNHLQISSFLVQSLGLGGPLPLAINTGLIAQTDDTSLDDDSYRARICWRWLESLRLTGNAPDSALRGDYYPRKEALAKLLEQVQPLNKEGQSCAFLAKGKDDVSPTTTPQLFRGSGAPVEGVPSPADDAPAVDEILEEI